MSEKNGGPAFPCEYVKHERGEVGNNVPIMAHSEGLSIRDYFAAKAMQGALAGSMADGAVIGRAEVTLLASLSYFVADAMLKERSK